MTGAINQYQALINSLFELGEDLLKNCGQLTEVQHKSDGSPLTEIDLFSNNQITHLLHNSSSLPILSEEKKVPFEERKHWQQFWMIDPLDGTKAYIKGKNDFTVNISLIENGRPILAFILVPAYKELYYAKLGHGAFVIYQNHEPIQLPLLKRKKMALFRSESHEGDEMLKFQSMNPQLEDIPLSSALKFCEVAKSGPACYVRFAGSSEWDVAAGDLIVTESGGKMVSFQDKKQFQYNSDSLRNPPFIALSHGCELSQLIC